MPKQLNFQKLLESVPTPDLLKAARLRARSAREQNGKYATQKKWTLCPKCKAGPFGVRELRRHNKVCKGKK